MGQAARATERERFGDAMIGGENASLIVAKKFGFRFREDEERTTGRVLDICLLWTAGGRWCLRSLQYAAFCVRCVSGARHVAHHVLVTCTHVACVRCVL